MHKTAKKIIASILISAATLATGFALTMVSFNLFDYLTTNQMRLLFAIDFICLIAVGGIFLYLSDNKEKKAKRRRYAEKRNNGSFTKDKMSFDKVNIAGSGSNRAA